MTTKLFPVRSLLASFCVFLLSACSGALRLPLPSGKAGPVSYLKSGSIIISRSIPADPIDNYELEGRKPSLAPVIGYFRNSKLFPPADNELWLEIDLDEQAILLMKGDAVLKKFHSRGRPNIRNKRSILVAKISRPLWYAPDSYYEARHLPVPSASSDSRYLRGALGNMALYLDDDIVIHSAPVWSPEVGGIRMAPKNLRSLFSFLNTGVQVLIK